MFAQPRRGRAWCGCPKPRRRSWLRKQSVRGPPTAITIRVVLTGRRRGPFVFVFELPIAYGETPELRFWALRNARRACPALLISFCVSASDRLPQFRARAIEEALHPVTPPPCIVIFANSLGRLR